MRTFTKFLMPGLGVLMLLACWSSATAQPVESKGVGSVQYESWGGPEPEDKARALEQAKANAIERYLASRSAATQKSFEKIRETILSSVDDYVISAAIVDETDDDDADRYTVVIRAEINAPRLESKLMDSSGAERGGDARAMAFVFVARRQTSVTRHGVSSDALSKTTRSTGESHSVEMSSGDTTGGLGHVESHSQAVATHSSSSETRRAADVSYDILAAGEIESAMTQVLATAGFEPVPAEYVLRNVAAIRDDFRHGNDPSSGNLREAAMTARSEGLNYLSFGTLDVGMRDQHPATGLDRVHVTVTGKILDVSGRFPRTVAAVGPVQFAGTGPNETVARTNALKLAAESVATELTDQLNARGK